MDAEPGIEKVVREDKVTESINMTKEQLQEILAAAISGAKQMNPLEQKKYNEELEKERRRARMMVTLGKAEEEARRNRELGCSHTRYPATHGKLAGHPAPRGQGEWCTGGQIHGYGLIGITCLRCGSHWMFRASQQELAYANDAGLMGFPPPPTERVLEQRCQHCAEMFTESEFAKHDAEACKTKADSVLAAAGINL